MAKFSDFKAFYGTAPRVRIFKYCSSYSEPFGGAG